MYAFGRWDEERVIQGLAVLMCLAMVGLMVMPASIGKLGLYLASVEHDNTCAGAGLLAGAAMIHGGWTAAHVAFEIAEYLELAGAVGAATGVGAACLLIGIGLFA
jgi:hypothetical protein